MTIPAIPRAEHPLVSIVMVTYGGKEWITRSLQALVAKPTVGQIPPNWKPYLDKLPNDPWGRPYQYASPGVRGEIDVYSLGADGQVGGEGKNADIGSWQ